MLPFWEDFGSLGGSWGGLGTPKGSIFGVFGGSNKEAKFETIFERFFWDLQATLAGNAELLEAF